MLRPGSAALVAASLLAAAASAACSTKPADKTAADTGSVSAGASAPAVDSAAATTTATDTARATSAPAAASTTPPPAPAPTSSKPSAPAGDSTRKSKAATPPAAPATGKTPTTKPAAPAASTSGASHASAPATPASSAPAAAPAAAATSEGQAGGPVKVNRFMSYDAAAKRVNLEVVAAFNSQQGGFNFNGGSNGSQTITVPAGWQIAMHVKNADAIPHSAIIIADQRPLPNAPDAPAIPRAYTSHVNDGLQPQSGADDLSFRASKPGTYLIYCGVPGHGPSGMFIKFVVSESATVPSYQM